jgi:hypothetical protein
LAIVIPRALNQNACAAILVPREEHHESGRPSSGCEGGQRELINIATADGFARRKAKNSGTQNAFLHTL